MQFDPFDRSREWMMRPVEIDGEGRQAPANPTPAQEFEVFFAATFPNLRDALTLVTRNHALGDDLAQEAFARVWQRWSRVRSMENPEGYTFRTGMRLAIDEQRAGKRATPLTEHAGADPYQAIEARTDLERELLQLPVRTRAALVLTELFGFDSRTAASILGVRPGTVRRQTSQAKKRLARGLSGREEQDD